MTIYQKILKQIDENDWNLAIASQKTCLMRKLCALFPCKNVFCLNRFYSKRADYRRNTTDYTLIVSKRYVHKFYKEDWKKMIVY